MLKRSSYKMVRLTSAQRKKKKFKHPLTDGAPPALKDADRVRLIDAYFQGSDEAKEKLIISFLSMLRSIVARYLYYWPLTRCFLDEMVSAGAAAIVKTVNNLTPERLEDKELSLILTRKIKNEIEDTVNRLRGVVSASPRQNQRREQQSKLPIYGLVEDSIFSADIKDFYGNHDLALRLIDIMDGLEQVAVSDLEKKIIAVDSWGLSGVELADRLGVNPRTVQSIRANLWKKYKQLMEAL